MSEQIPSTGVLGTALTLAFAGRRALQRCCHASKLICCSIKPRSHPKSVQQALLRRIMPWPLLLPILLLLLLLLLAVLMMLLLTTILLLPFSLQLLLVLQRACSLLCDT